MLTPELLNTHSQQHLHRLYCEAHTMRLLASQFPQSPWRQRLARLLRNWAINLEGQPATPKSPKEVYAQRPP